MIRDAAGYSLVNRAFLSLLAATILASCGGGTAPSVQPEPETPTTLRFSSVSAGSNHVCGISTSGAAWCWGNNRAGQLGTGSTGGVRTTPAAVAGGLRFASISAGFERTCAVTTGGAAYCWGIVVRDPPNNNTTQLGDSVPVAVAGGLRFAMVSAGFTHICGVTTDGAAYCWGNTSRIGSSTALSNVTPTRIPGEMRYTTVSAANGFACALTAQGAAYCWGDNFQGKLGNGATSGLVTSPGAVTGGLTFTSLSSGLFRTCGVTTRGATYCWGPDYAPPSDVHMEAYGPTPVPIQGAPTFATLAAGGNHTCGVTADGAAWCWGYNGVGQLGNGMTVNSAAPVRVAGSLRFASVSAGTTVTCGVTIAGAAHCWGGNYFGTLGVGTNGPASPVPVEVGRTDQVAARPANLLPPVNSPPPAGSRSVVAPTPRAADSAARNAYFEFQVERPVGMLPDSPPPVYPTALRQAKVDGEVVAAFVVDTMGLAELATFKVLRSSHQEFTDAVLAVLPRMHYSPAMVGGRKVRQLVQQPFYFHVTP
jgi:alpha-tubulin suppressor-like RCC1 family protein